MNNLNDNYNNILVEYVYLNLNKNKSISCYFKYSFFNYLEINDIVEFLKGNITMKYKNIANRLNDYLDINDKMLCDNILLLSRNYRNKYTFTNNVYLLYYLGKNICIDFTNKYCCKQIKHNPSIIKILAMSFYAHLKYQSIIKLFNLVFEDLLVMPFSYICYKKLKKRFIDKMFDALITYKLNDFPSICYFHYIKYIWDEKKIDQKYKFFVECHLINNNKIKNKSKYETIPFKIQEKYSQYNNYEKYIECMKIKI